MKTFTFILKGKRPVYATDNLALQRVDTEGISMSQLAREWGITPAMVRRMVLRARKKLAS